MTLGEPIDGNLDPEGETATEVDPEVKRRRRFVAEVSSAGGEVTLSMNGLGEAVGLRVDPAFAGVEHLPRIEAAVVEAFLEVTAGAGKEDR